LPKMCIGWVDFLENTVEENNQSFIVK
jgi:hypothetical protein